MNVVQSCKFKLELSLNTTALSILDISPTYFTQSGKQVKVSLNQCVKNIILDIRLTLPVNNKA